MLTRVKARLVRAPRAVFIPPYAKGSANTRAFSRPIVEVDLDGLAKELEYQNEQGGCLVSEFAEILCLVDFSTL